MFYNYDKKISNEDKKKVENNASYLAITFTVLFILGFISSIIGLVCNEFADRAWVVSLLIILIMATIFISMAYGVIRINKI